MPRAPQITPSSTTPAPHPKPNNKLKTANLWLQGTLPPELGNLRQLRRLLLGANFLRGALGPWIGGLKALEVLRLGANAGVNADGTAGFSGPIPAALADLPNLIELDLQANAFTGTIPAALCAVGSRQAARLRLLNLRGNRLSGPAAGVARCGELEVLDLSDNQLTGTLPASAVS